LPLTVESDEKWREIILRENKKERKKERKLKRKKERSSE
jgi:hypothetical protein